MPQHRSIWLVVLVSLAIPALPAHGQPIDVFAAAPTPRIATLQKSVVPGATFARLAGDALAQLRSASHATVALPTDDGPLSLDLERVDVLRPGATVTSTDYRGSHAYDPQVVCLRGSVEGEPLSTAVLTVSPNGAMGLVEARGRRWAIAPVEGDLHRIADESQLPATPLRCDMDEADAKPPREGLRARHRPPGTIELNPYRYVCNLAVDCDYEWYSLKSASSVTNAMQYVMTMFSAISIIYERDIGTTIQLGYLNVWTTAADPYTASTAQDELFEFKDWWNANRGAVPRTIAHLVSGRNLGGGYAYIGVLCDPLTAYGVTSTNGGDLMPNNVTNRDVYLLAHEVGHQFGSFHTQSCNWAFLGYVPTGTLLDSCYAAEGTCYTGPVGIIPRDKGTIMSYCNTIAGGSQSNIRLVFHPACADWMRMTVESSGCMIQAAVQPPSGLTATPAGAGAHLAWRTTPTPDVIRHDVYRSSFQQDPAPELVGSTADTTFDDPIPWSTFYYRVRAVTSSGTSEASNEVEVNRCPMVVTGSVATNARPLALASGDFNADGNLDLAVAHSGSGPSLLEILLGNGSGGFSAPVPYPVDSAGVQITTGDFNEDGIVDLVVCALAGNRIDVLFGRGAAGVGDGTFAPMVRYPVPGAIAAAPADFNEDGIVDLAVADYVNGVIRIMLGQGDTGVGNGTFVAGATILGLGSEVGNVLARELNGDGIMDLIFVRAAGIGVLIGNGAGGKGDGTFSVGASVGTGGTQGFDFATGDLNGDGKLDVAVEHLMASGQHPRLSVLIGNGDGTFGPPVDYQTATNTVTIAMADLTGDGLDDVAVGSNIGTDGVWIHRGLGDGRLGGPTWINTTAAVRYLLPSDFDGDGVLDLVTSNGANASVSLIRTACDRELANGATVTSPNGGEVWETGGEHVISWTLEPGCKAVNLDLSRDAGDHWEALAQNVVGTSFAWTATLPVSSRARLRVSNAYVVGASDASDADFILTSTVPTLLALVRGDAGPAGVTLLWQGVNAGGLLATVWRRAPADGWRALGVAERDGHDLLRYADASVVRGARYAYQLRWSEEGAEHATAEAWVEVPAAAVLTLDGLRPNPAVDALQVSFALASAGPATLELLDLGGRRVLDREVGSLGAGTHLLRLGDGALVAPGLYWLRLRQGGQQRMVRAVVMR